MSDAVWLDGKEYISSKRASELSGYAQDYIGQLARKGIIDAQRIGGLWHISMPSLLVYKSNADTYTPQQPERKAPIEADSLIAFDGKDHISASRAAKITGYHPDYVGQLARSGAIISRQVGNRWFIDREGILAHKREKDRLLGAVQAQSVGIVRGSAAEVSTQEKTPANQSTPGTNYNGPGPFLTYTSDDRDLLPAIGKPHPVSGLKEGVEEHKYNREHSVPIRKIRSYVPDSNQARVRYESYAPSKVRTHGKTINYAVFGKLAVSALTVVIVLSFGFVTLKDHSIYSANTVQGGAVIGRNAFTAGAAEALRRAGDFLEDLLVKDLIYKRGN